MSQPQNQDTTPTFNGLGIAPKLLEALDRMKFHTPTPIQQKAIPPANEGKDIVGIAQTGTGKTLAFALPTIQTLAQKKGRALVLVPTRELALQVEETFVKIQGVFGIRSVVLIGGASMHNQIINLRKNPRVIIATPGRLLDHMGQRTVSLPDLNILVLDEADRMLDMGFMPQIQQILKIIPRERQTMLFSATLPGEIMKIATRHMKLPISIEVAPSGTTAEKVTQELFVIKNEMKRTLLNKLLEKYRGSVLLFCRTKIGAQKITRALKASGWSAGEIHSDRSMGQRKEALDGFKSGKYRILVATDIASRGIDVSGIELVVNYDLPDDVENFVHRIGRTARAGRTGHAITFATPDQYESVRSIERLIRATIPISEEHPDIPKEAFVKKQVGIQLQYQSRHGSHGHSSHGGGSGQNRSFRGRRR